jgi:hypothetical protein
VVTYALFTNTSIDLHSPGSRVMNPRTSSGFETSNLRGRTLVFPWLSASISSAIIRKFSIRRAVKINRMSGDVRENSKAVDLPIPEDAPVIRMVFCDRRDDIRVDIFHKELTCVYVDDCFRRWTPKDSAACAFVAGGVPCLRQGWRVAGVTFAWNNR